MRPNIRATVDGRAGVVPSIILDLSRRVSDTAPHGRARRCGTTMGTVLARLELPNDLALLGIARAYTREVAAAANLPLEDGAALVWAVEAACSDIVEHAFDPGESSTFTIAAELSATALTIALHERGLPFDPSQVAADAAPPAEDTAVAAARGSLWQHIAQAVDEAHWINHGPAGIALRPTKGRPLAVALAPPPPDASA